MSPDPADESQDWAMEQSSAESEPLAGVPAGVWHPARRGGRVTDVPTVAARLTLRDDVLQIHDAEEIEDFEIRFADIVYCREGTQEINKTAVKSLAVRHLDPPSTVLTTAISAWDDTHHDRLTRLVTDYYHTQREAIATFEPSPAQLELLVRFYSMGGEIDLAEVLDYSKVELTELFGPLREAGVIRKGDTGVFLTGRGYMLVNEEIDDDTL
jgi:helix-turn-helix protein